MPKRKPIKYESTVEGAISDAFSIIEELAGEMREAFDNTPEGLQQSGVGEARGTAADELENISEPSDIAKALGEVKVAFEHLPLKRNPSRATRMGEATQILSVVIDTLNGLDFKANKEKAEERDALEAEVQEMHDAADQIEFPGMYG